MAFSLVEIDDVLRPDHYYLTAEDECYFFGEYHPRAGYAAGPVNDLISNFKKSVLRRERFEYRHKERATCRIGQLIRQEFKPEALAQCTFVPIPPSKAKNHPEYDDRLVRALNSGTPRLDVRELVVMRGSTRAHHEFEAGEKRPTPDDLYELLDVDPALLAPPIKRTLVLFDDVITNGTHFAACKRLLLERLPNQHIVGLFIGRRKPLDPFAIDDLL